MGSITRQLGQLWAEQRALTGKHGTFYPPYLSSFACVGFLAIRKVFNGHGHTIGTPVFGNSSLWGGGYLAVGMLVLVAHKEVT